MASWTWRRRVAHKAWRRRVPLAFGSILVAGLVGILVAVYQHLLVG